MGTFTSEELSAKLQELGIRAHSGKNVIYKYVPVDIARIILSDGLIRYAIPSTFIDSNDMSLSLYDFTNSDQERRVYADEYLFLDTPPAVRAALIEKFAKSDMESVLRKTASVERDKTPVFCGSTDYTIPKMWEQYADGAKGVCLGIQLPQSMGRDNIVMFTGHMKYMTKMEPVKYLPNTDLHKIAATLHWIYSKSSQYNIEKEVRSVLIDFGGDMTLVEEKYKYATLLLSELYFGEKCSKADIDDLTRIVLQKKYPIEKQGKMYYPERSFELDVKYMLNKPAAK